MERRNAPLRLLLTLFALCALPRRAIEASSDKELCQDKQQDGAETDIDCGGPA